MYTVKTVDIDEFRNSRNRWNNLVLSMKRPSIFCTWEWIYTWWEHFGKNYEPIILFVYKDAKLVGILPLAYHKTSNVGFIGRKLSYCGSMELYPDHLDIICSKEDAGQCLDAVFEFLKSEYKEWDVFYLSHLSEDSLLLQWLNKQKKSFNIKKVTVSPYITLVGSFNEYMRRFSGKHRHNMNRLKNRLYREYGIQFSTCNNNKTSEIESNLNELFQLHRLRKLSTKTKSTFTGQTLLCFHNDLSHKLGKAGWLRLSSLRKGDKAVAIGYAFTFGKYFSYYQSGFDPEWERHSVGSIFLIELIENAYKEGCVEFDFLRGNEKYKSSWTQESRALFNINLYNKSFRGALLKHAYRARNQVRKVFNDFRNKS